MGGKEKGVLARKLEGTGPSFTRTTRRIDLPAMERGGARKDRSVRIGGILKEDAKCNQRKERAGKLSLEGGRGGVAA